MKSKLLAQQKEKQKKEIQLLPNREGVTTTETCHVLIEGQNFWFLVPEERFLEFSFLCSLVLLCSTSMLSIINVWHHHPVIIPGWLLQLCSDQLDCCQRKANVEEREGSWVILKDSGLGSYAMKKDEQCSPAGLSTLPLHLEASNGSSMPKLGLSPVTFHPNHFMDPCQVFHTTFLFLGKKKVLWQSPGIGPLSSQQRRQQFMTPRCLSGYF